MKKLIGIVLLASAFSGCIFSMNDDYEKGGGSGSDFTISGSFMDRGGKAIEGLTVVLSGDKKASVVTDENGAYSFTGLSAGSYSVLPGESGHGPSSVILSSTDVSMDVNSDGHMSQLNGNYTCSQCHKH